MIYSRGLVQLGFFNHLMTVDPNKACKSILFTEGSPEVKIKNTWLMKLTHYTFALALDLLSNSKHYFCTFMKSLDDRDVCKRLNLQYS